MAPSPLCPCGTGVAFARCCRPLHRGEREAEDAEALMRSRYAAFAKNEAAYLWRTLHPKHEDRAMGEAAAVASIKATASEHRYMGLRVLDRRGPDEGGTAQVLFHARVFHKGVDMSFVELSDFQHDGVGWRYLRGEGLSTRQLGVPPDGLTIATAGPLLKGHPATG